MLSIPSAIIDSTRVKTDSVQSRPLWLEVMSRSPRHSSLLVGHGLPNFRLDTRFVKRSNNAEKGTLIARMVNKQCSVLFCANRTEHDMTGKLQNRAGVGTPECARLKIASILDLLPLPNPKGSERSI